MKVLISSEKTSKSAAHHHHVCVFWVMLFIPVVLIIIYYYYYYYYYASFMDENYSFGGGHMTSWKAANINVVNNTAIVLDTAAGRIDGDAKKMSLLTPHWQEPQPHQQQQQQQQPQQQQQQHHQQLQQHEHQDDVEPPLLVLLPVSTNNSGSYSIEMLPHLPRNGFLVTTTLEFSIVLPGVISSTSPHSLRRTLPFSWISAASNWKIDPAAAADDDDDDDTRRTASSRIEVEHHYGHRLERTSNQAKRHNCTIAVNAGPFNKDGSCVGTVVVNGQVIYNTGSSSSSSVGFGITAGGPAVRRRHWVLGTLASPDEDIPKLGIVHFVTGFDWLVQDGVNVGTANGRNNTTGAERAPRTSIGVDHRGRLVILVTNGCELWYVRSRDV
jgi:Phosphodiester glycosidase